MSQLFLSFRGGWSPGSSTWFWTKSVKLCAGRSVDPTPRLSEQPGHLFSPSILVQGVYVERPLRGRRIRPFWNLVKTLQLLVQNVPESQKLTQPCTAKGPKPQLSTCNGYTPGHTGPAHDHRGDHRLTLAVSAAPRNANTRNIRCSPK